MEGHAFHRNLFDLPVIQLVALAQEVGTLLRIGDDGNHSVRGFHNTVQTQRADLQTCFARGKIFRQRVLRLLAPDQRFEGIAAGYFLLARDGFLVGNCSSHRRRRLCVFFPGWFCSRLGRWLCRRRLRGRFSGWLADGGGRRRRLRAHSGRCKQRNPN